ncbi:hypothetical protein [Hugenholtzia roseola]|uniref:hypothetical protein n=1 Tax=Hugenholtzia roseola TaxID=1002 RepID=UPI0004240A33|nr:hypothetical protein [Hugenholtzia roseola]
MSANLTITFDTAFATAGYNATNKWVYASAKTYYRLDQYQELWRHILELVQKNKTGKLFLDDRLGKVIPPGHLEWVFGEIVPEMIKVSGKIRVAIVLSDDVFYQVAINNAERRTTLFGGALQLSQFKDVEEAQAWLISQ